MIIKLEVEYYTDDEAIGRRLTVRESHLAKALPNPAIKIGGAIVSPDEALDTPDAPRKMIGSTMIIECESYAKAKELVETDIYWTGNVWDKEKTVIHPFVSAKPL